MKHQPPPKFGADEDILEQVFFGLPKGPGGSRAAERSFREFRSTDPFPSVEPALLNTADLIEYVAATGMIFPFYPRKEYLKPASYAIRLMGPWVFWNREGEKKSGLLGLNDTFTLEQDSIAFVTLEPELRLPDYIAMRFNLRIRNVYRGLLLGTGPLVDPGFVGRLSIPLHNLTTGEYILKGGDTLIWAEFTKLSSNERWKSSKPERDRKWKAEDLFQGFGKDAPAAKDVHDYLEKASGGQPVRSSIPSAIFEARDAAEGARRTSLLTIIAVIVALVPLAFLILGFGRELLVKWREQERTYEVLEQKIDSVAGEIDALRDSIERLQE